MGKLSSLLWGAAIGAGMMYFLDPQNGNRRQAMVRDQMYRLQNKGDDALNTAMNDMRNRVSGLLAEGMAIVNEESVPDQVLESRIRSRLGFVSRHPGAIQVSVQNRVATLTGDVLADEEDSLMKGLSRVRGVKSVVNNLRAHQDAGNIPQLQGEGWLPGQNATNNWSPSTRLMAGVGAAYLLLYGTFRGGLIGTLARLSGVALGSRALTNQGMRQMTGMDKENAAIRVRKTININAPVEEVYGLWSNFENFPRFMHNVEAIHTSGGNRSHWVVKGPAGSKVEFDAIETQNIPNELIAWRTTPDSQVVSEGQVRFKEQGNGTQVSVNMAYTPPAGIAGAAVASLFGKDPKSEMDADLARMKSLLEQGQTTADNRKVRRDEVMPVTGPGRGGQPGDMRHERGQGQGNRGGNSGMSGSGSGGSTSGSGGVAGKTGGGSMSSTDQGGMTGGDTEPLVPPDL